MLQHETQTPATSTSEGQPQPPEVRFEPEAPTSIPAEREAVLRRLLDGPTGGIYHNYDSAKELGLIDMFEYSPDTGRDALVHMLSGEEKIGDEGAEVVQGFHHEPSGTHGPHEHPSTVDREHLEGKKARSRRVYEEYPFEPYQARVVVAGREKMTAQTDSQTGETRISHARNNMYPNEYDALPILQAIRIVLQNRDPEEDVPTHKGRRIVEGFAPMIDNKSLMKIRIVINSEGKVVTAHPIAKFKGIMRLSAAAVKQLEQGEELN